MLCKAVHMVLIVRINSKCDVDISACSGKKSSEHSRTTHHFIYMSNMLYFITFLFLGIVLKWGPGEHVNEPYFTGWVTREKAININ